jgi:citrate synthase
LLIHQRLAKGWGKEKDVADLLRKAMVLLADHELTSSAFATRIAASNGASLPACLLTGLATFTGPLHGDATPRVKALLDEVERSSAEQVVNRYLSSALPIPGFGHHLYPDGDRARLPCWKSSSRRRDRQIYRKGHDPDRALSQH